MDDGRLESTFEDGQVIVRQGETGECLYELVAGQAEVVAETTHGEVPLAVLGTGEVFGEMALLTGAPRSATVRALGEARVLVIDREAFLSRVQGDPGFALLVMQQMCSRTQKLDSEISRLRNETGEASPAARSTVWL